MSDAAFALAESAAAALDTEFARLDRRIARAIARLRARYELSLDEFRGLYISDAQVDDLLAARGDRVDTDPSIDESPLRAATEFADTPWSRLSQALGLDDDARNLVLLALAPEVDAKYESLFAYLNNDVARRMPTAELATRLFGASRSHRTAIRGALAPDAPLLRHGVLELATGGRDPPRAQRGFRLAAPLADWLQGLPWSDERLRNLATFTLPSAREAAALLAPKTAQRAEHAARWLTGEKGEPPTFVCTGPTIAEAVLAASALFAFAGRPTLTLDLAALRASANAADAIAACELIQRVLGIGLIATPLDAIQDAEPRPTDAGLVALRELLARSPALALVAGPSPRWREATAERRILEVRSDPLPASERARVWRQMIGEPVDERVVEALADRFVLGADRIARAAAIAHDAKTIGERRALAVGDLYDAARWVSNDAFTATTQTADLPYDWDDLIVPAEVRTRLSDLLQAVELRPQVLGQWGFGGRLGGARGIKVLFAGASGTGKTMAAAVIAKSLGVDLHRVDLAATVSKYIGETEKNLDRAFAAARRANAILFIDEAEALLGKRSEVRDAHDRYANVETAYLLQRMEEHDGVVVLATNLAQNIDEAFSRRMHYVIDFPMPDAGSREALWRRMIPPEAPLADDVDFAFLARRFALAGGDIRNLVLDAAYRAAQAGDAIGMRHMLRAVMQQFAKRGRVPAVGEFGPYAAMLAVAGDGNAPPRPHHSAPAEALAAAAES